MTRVEWSGFDEFIRDLKRLPDDLQDEGRQIMTDEVEGASGEIRRAYPQVTGTLQRRVRTTYPSSSVLVGLVQSTAPHSHLYEFGTGPRQTATGADRGVMWQGKTRRQSSRPYVMVPVVQRRRASMARRMVEMLRRAGFQVGDA